MLKLKIEKLDEIDDHRLKIDNELTKTSTC